MTPAPANTLVFHASAELPTVPLEWLWEPYLARGSLAILDGDPGVGKSFLSLDLAARITTGRPMPNCDAAPAEPGRVVVVSAEDPIEDVVLPRFRAAGGDPSRLTFFGGLSRTGVVERVAVFPPDFAVFARQLRAEPPALVVLDPFAALFPTTVSDARIARTLKAFATLAVRLRTCVLFVRHLNKSGRPKSLYRGRGSIGLSGGVRTVLMAGMHPCEKGRSVLSVVKSNFAEPGHSIGYHVGELAAGVGVMWDGPTNLTADDLCRTVPEDVWTTDRMHVWLYELLKKGPVPATEVEAAAASAGIGFRTLTALKRRFKIESKRVVKKGKPARWEWVWPPEVLRPLGPIFG